MHAARILLVDDHDLVREAMMRLFEREADIKLAASCASVMQALDIVSRQAIDLVLLDYDLGDELGTEFLSAAASRGYHGPVLVLTGGLSTWAMRQLLSHGVAGIVLKNCPTATLIACIRLALSGQTCESNPLLMPALTTGRAQRLRLKEFTQRELQVLRAVVNGKTNKEIAGQLCVSESSVKCTLQQLFDKTGVRSRSQLVRLTLEQLPEHTGEANRTTRFDPSRPDLKPSIRQGGILNLL